MLGRLVRGAYVLFVAAMIVTWAMSASKSAPAQPQSENTVVNWWC